MVCNINHSISGKAQLIMYGTFMKNLFLCQHIPTTYTLFGFKLHKSSTNLHVSMIYLENTFLHILLVHLLGSIWSKFNQVIATFVLSRILHLNMLQNKWITECIIVKYCKDFHNLLFLSHKVSFVLCDFLMWFSSKAHGRIYPSSLFTHFECVLLCNRKYLWVSERIEF